MAKHRDDKQAEQENKDFHDTLRNLPTYQPNTAYDKATAKPAPKKP